MNDIISHFAPVSLDIQGIDEKNFSEKIEKDFVYIPESKILAICIPGWGRKLREWKSVRDFYLARGVSVLIYQFPLAILSNNKELTKNLFEISNATIREEITLLKKQYDFKTCILTGMSLGCALGSMVYKDNSDIDEIFLIVPGENLARDMWTGYRTQHLRKSYEQQGVTRLDLENLWFDLAPENNLPAENTRLNLFFGRRDKIIPFELGYRLYEILKKRNVNVTAKIYPLGHYFTAAWFLLRPNRFLRRTIDALRAR